MAHVYDPRQQHQLRTVKVKPGLRHSTKFTPSLGLSQGCVEPLVVYSLPEKYEVVSWVDEIPKIWKNTVPVPNHQPVFVGKKKDTICKTLCFRVSNPSFLALKKRILGFVESALVLTFNLVTTAMKGCGA